MEWLVISVLGTREIMSSRGVLVKDTFCFQGYVGGGYEIPSRIEPKKMCSQNTISTTFEPRVDDHGLD